MAPPQGNMSSISHNISVHSSPIKNNEQVEKQQEQYRVKSLMSRLYSWFAVSLFMSFEYFVLHGSVGNCLFGSLIPGFLLSYLELCIVVYTSVVTIYLFFYSLSPIVSSSILKNAVVSSPIPSMDHSILNSSSISSSQSPLNTSSIRATPKSREQNMEWVDHHKFGVSPLQSPIQTPINVNKSFSSPLDSLNTSSSRFDTVMRTLSDESSSPFQSRIPLSVSPQSKMMNPIHTQDQLDRLLRNDGDLSIHDVSSSFKNGSSLFFNMLDVTGTGGEKLGYQLSEPNKQETKDGINVSHIRISSERVELSPTPLPLSPDNSDDGTKFRQTLNAQRNANKGGIGILRRSESIEKRRRSHSSPDRTLLGLTMIGGSSGSGTNSGGGGGGHALPEIDDNDLILLSESDFHRCEPRVRVWLVNTVLKPVSEQIKKMNALFDKDHASLHLRIGTSSVETLRAAMVSKPELAATQLPFLLPLLEMHTNQAYIVSRISQLSTDNFIKDYSWNGGGNEPRDEKLGIPGGRLAPLGWKDHLPTDSFLLFNLFVGYMDAMVASSSFIGCRVDQPFSYRYILRNPSKPNILQSTAESFYLHWTSSSPPNIDLVVVGPHGTPARVPVTKGPNNVFRAILSFIHHVKTNGNGYIEKTNINKEGINIGCILD